MEPAQARLSNRYSTMVVKSGEFQVGTRERPTARWTRVVLLGARACEYSYHLWFEDSAATLPIEVRCQSRPTAL